MSLTKIKEHQIEFGNKVYADLRAYTGSTEVFYVGGHATAGDGGQGVFRLDSSDTTSADNGGTILVDARQRGRSGFVRLSCKCPVVCEGLSHELPRLRLNRCRRRMPCSVGRHHCHRLRPRVPRRDGAARGGVRAVRRARRVELAAGATASASRYFMAASYCWNYASALRKMCVTMWLGDVQYFRNALAPMRVSGRLCGRKALGSGSANTSANRGLLNGSDTTITH